MKIAQIVAFNIASEASYVYILSGQKLEMPKMVKNVKIEKFKCDILSNFQTNVLIVFYSQLVAQLLFPDATKP